MSGTVAEALVGSDERHPLGFPHEAFRCDRRLEDRSAELPRSSGEPSQKKSRIILPTIA